MLEVQLERVAGGSLPINLRDGSQVMASLSADDAMALAVELLRAKWLSDPDRKPFIVTIPERPVATSGELARVAVAMVSRDHTDDDLAAILDYTPENIAGLLGASVFLARELGEAAGMDAFSAVLERVKRDSEHEG